MTMQILLVEDNPADMCLLKDLFEETGSDCALQWVTDGYEALDYVYHRNGYDNAKRPDVILLDLGLPRIDGYDVLKELKKTTDYATIPIIILTTSRNPLDRSQCERLGADGFLSKPYNLKGYEQLVQQLVNMEIPRVISRQREARVSSA